MYDPTALGCQENATGRRDFDAHEPVCCRLTALKRSSPTIGSAPPQQGKSGLGLEAQRATVERFAADNGFEVVAVFTEIETGKGTDALDRRPQLAAALKAAKAQKCPVGVSGSE